MSVGEALVTNQSGGRDAAVQEEKPEEIRHKPTTLRDKIQPKMGSSIMRVTLLAVLVAWSSLGNATPIPSTSPTPTPTPMTSSVAPTTRVQEEAIEPKESADEQQRQVDVPQEPEEVPEGFADVPQPPPEVPDESNDSPIQQRQTPFLSSFFNDQVPILSPGFAVSNNPDGQSDGTGEEIVEMEREGEEMDETEVGPSEQQEQVPFQEQMMARVPIQSREPEEESEPVPQIQQEQVSFQEQMMARVPIQSREPEEESEPEPQIQQQEVGFPEQTMVQEQSREPEEQSEDGQEETVDLTQEEEDPAIRMISNLEFQKPTISIDQFPSHGFHSFPAEDSPHFNEVEGMYANQQEGFLPQDFPMQEQIPMREFRPME